MRNHAEPWVSAGLIVLLTFCVISGAANAQQPNPPTGLSKTIDGVVEPGEWSGDDVRVCDNIYGTGKIYTAMEDILVDMGNGPEVGKLQTHCCKDGLENRSRF